MATRFSLYPNKIKVSISYDHCLFPSNCTYYPIWGAVISSLLNITFIAILSIDGWVGTWHPSFVYVVLLVVRRGVLVCTIPNVIVLKYQMSTNRNLLNN